MELLEALKFRRPEIVARDEEWKLASLVASGNLVTQSNGSWSSEWLPKGRLEPIADYSMRVRLTPFLPITPQIVRSQIGAILQNEISKSDHPVHKIFTTRGQNIQVAAADTMRKALYYGMVAGFLNIPAGSPHPKITLYPGPQIWDWSIDSTGKLVWAKLVEAAESPHWNKKTGPTIVIRIVDSTTIKTYVVSNTEIVSSYEQLHDYGQTPVFFLQPELAEDGCGQMPLSQNLFADLAATRLLSDLIWSLYILGQPILTYKTNRTDEELETLISGASRYLPLKNGRPGVEDAESMEFLQLDPTGIDFLFRAFETMQSRAAGNDQTHKPGVSPNVQSGAAIAWKFKTEELPLLSNLAQSTEAFLNSLLSLAGAPPVNFPTAQEILRLREPDLHDNTR